MSLNKLSDIEKAATPGRWKIAVMVYVSTAEGEVVLDCDPVMSKNVELTLALRNLAKPLIEVAKAAEGHDCNMGCKMCSTLATLRAAIEKEISG